MRRVLLDLEMTANGRVSSLDSSGVGDADWSLVDDRGRGKLGIDDAPHLAFAALWKRAATDVEREAVIAAATETLQRIRISRGDPSLEESKADRDKRIVAEGAGLPARDVAVWARCGVRDVYRARQAAGRDTQHGLPVRNGHELDVGERKAEIEALTRQGMNPRQVAHALNLSPSTVRRSLGSKR